LWVGVPLALRVARWPLVKVGLIASLPVRRR
jgi:hypothetical protein